MEIIAGNVSKDFYDTNVKALPGNSCVWRRLQKTYLQHKSKPLPAVLKSRLDGPSTDWKVFKHLNEAVEYANSKHRDCMVFSFEERTPTSTGQRLFLVAHPQHMWLNHKNRTLEERCTYEVIREGSPCKLYFDLEFQANCNSDKDGNEMTKIFIKCIIALVLEHYNIRLSISDFIWLDSSTEKKFSCHLILLMKNTAFRNNIEAGKFVHLLLSKILLKIETNALAVDGWPSCKELKKLLIISKDERATLFCDEGVYTKNRNFRLYLSTKFHKKTPLILSTCSLYPANRKCLEEEIFYDSLITYFRQNEDPKELLYCHLESDSGIQNKILFPKRSSNSAVTGQALPFSPELDSFVLNLVWDELSVGFIRKWTYLNKDQLIVYDIGNYRFCSNIGRHHKSNNIMIVVDFKSKMYYQKCHDPVCQKEQYRSKAFPVPENILLLNVPEDFFDDDCFSQGSHGLEENPVSATDSSFNKYDLYNVEDIFLQDSFFEGDFVSQFENSVKMESNSLSKYDLCSIKDFFQQELSNDDTFFSQLNELRKPEISAQNKDALNEDITLENSMFDECFTNYDFENTLPNIDSKAKNSCFLNENHPNSNSNDDASSEEFNCADISAEDEMLMAEAASMIEDSLIVDDVSEETVF